MATTKTKAVKKATTKKAVSPSGPTESKLYSTAGKEVGTVALPQEIFGLSWNADLVHQVVTSMMSNARAGTADTKGRGEVRGGGKKPWKQKGTGRARHGSSRSPIWKGGGITHGPLAEKSYKKKINKKMKTKALYMVLAQKLRDGHILFVEGLEFKSAKTKDAAKVFNTLAGIKGFERLGGEKKTATVTIPSKNDAVLRAVRNLSTVELAYLQEVNPVDLMSKKYVVITNPEESFKVLAGRMGK